MKILHKSPGKGGRGGGGGGKGEGERGEGGIKYCQTFSPAKSINHLQSANFIFAQIISGRKQRCPCPAQPPQLKRQSHKIDTFFKSVQFHLDHDYQTKMLTHTACCFKFTEIF